MELIRCLATLVLLGFAAAVGSTTIYKSVDGEGRVTFSDQPPVEGEVVDILEYQEPQTGRPALDRERIEAMREVTDRMAADRREREASRARAARQPSEPALHNQKYVDSLDNRDYDGFYPVRVLRKRPGHHRPGTRPPHHRPPIARPHPQDPAHAIGTARYNQYPANLIRRHYTSAARRVFYPEGGR